MGLELSTISVHNPCASRDGKRLWNWFFFVVPEFSATELSIDALDSLEALLATCSQNRRAIDLAGVRLVVEVDEEGADGASVAKTVKRR
jgi:hypothetical protein